MKVINVQAEIKELECLIQERDLNEAESQIYKLIKQKRYDYTERDYRHALYNFLVDLEKKTFRK